MGGGDDASCKFGWLPLTPDLKEPPRGLYSKLFNEYLFWVRWMSFPALTPRKPGRRPSLKYILKLLTVFSSPKGKTWIFVLKNKKIRNAKGQRVASPKPSPISSCFLLWQNTSFSTLFTAISCHGNRACTWSVLVRQEPTLSQLCPGP